MKILNISKRNILLLVPCLIFIIYIGNFIVSVVGYSENLNATILAKNWDITINNTLYNNISLDKFTFKNTNTGDKMTMECVLPDKTIDNPCIAVKLFHCVVNAYIDDTNIYSYGQNYIDNKKSVGSGYHIISLPPGYEGKKITIYLDVMEINAFPNIKPVIFISEQNFSKYIIRKNILDIIVSIFLIVLGIISINISLIWGKFRGEYRKLFWVGYLSLTASMWTMSYANFMQLIVGNLKIPEYTEFLGLYGIAPATAMVLYESTPKKTFIHKLPKTVAMIFIPFIMCVLICNATNIAHIPLFLFASHIYMGISIVIVSICLMHNIHNKKKSEMILIYGLGLEIVIAIIEVIRFNLIKYISNNSYDISFFPLTIGFFVIMLLVSYIKQYIEYMEDLSEQNALYNIAYKDPLTGLASRTKCEEFMKEITSKNIEDYAIISFDLNNLKKINDTQGHAKGDEYIVNFSKLLKSVFSNFPMLGRMGGDEFIAILYNEETSSSLHINDNFIENIIKSLIEKANNDNISFAYGYAISTSEKPQNIIDLYKHSDNEMYKCKSTQKKVAIHI